MTSLVLAGCSDETTLVDQPDSGDAGEDLGQTDVLDSGVPDSEDLGQTDLLDSGVPDSEESDLSVPDIFDEVDQPGEGRADGAACEQDEQCLNDNCRGANDGNSYCTPSNLACSDGLGGGYSVDQGFCLDGVAVACTASDMFSQEDCREEDCGLALGMCQGGACLCPETCTHHDDCVEDAFCAADQQCAELLADGEACSMDEMCQNDNCRLAPTAGHAEQQFCVPHGMACATPDGQGMNPNDSLCLGTVAWTCDGEDTFSHQDCGADGCSAGQCGECEPACGDRECGPDGCDGVCGACTGDTYCVEDAGACIPDGWVLVYPGSYFRGSPEGELGQNLDGREQPRHQVTLTRPFIMKATAATQGEWESVMGSNPSEFDTCGANCPVESITFWQAAAYLNLLSEDEILSPCYFSDAVGTPYTALDAHHGAAPSWSGLDCTGYRLPTEAEWEYAARAGTYTAMWAGDLASDQTARDNLLSQYAWYVYNAANSTHPVGLKEPNPWGLHDILGNVWEMVWDRETEYGAIALTDPIGGGLETGLHNRIIRGGSYMNASTRMRAADRGFYYVEHSYGYIGFRPVRTVILPE